MHLTEFTDQVLLCHEDDVSQLPVEITLHSKQSRAGSLFAWDIGGKCLNLDALLQRECYTVNRYLDRFHIWLPDNSIQRQEILDLFFDTVAVNYDKLIEPDRNVENIQYMLKILCCKHQPSADCVIIDLGCGTGLSVKANQRSNCKLIGIDHSDSMRKFSSARGMVVLNNDEIENIAPKSIDGIISSYLFHLLPDLSLLRLLWPCLRIGGAFVANFHKGKGITRVSELLLNLGAFEEMMPGPQSSFNHGEYRKYVRVP